MLAPGYGSSKPSSQPRQRPGAACNECRRRKLRCDGRHPKCGVCSKSDITCTVNTSRAPRGPKKGHLKALQSRLVTLERLLDDQSGGPDRELVSRRLQCPPYNDSVVGSPRRPPDILPTLPMDKRSQLKPVGHSGRTSIQPEQPGLPQISDLMGADMDELYFDRVHIFAPMLHRRRYLSWAKHPTKSDSQRALQYAMWALAASLSTHLQDIRDSLYQNAKDILERLELCSSVGAISIEQAQAWILVAGYEIMRRCYDLGWITAGRSFRVVQLMRLYELDNPIPIVETFGTILQDDVIAKEEKRRTFWVAYNLDRYLSISTESPLTINDYMVSTRLPASETDYQSGQLATVVGFLSEVIESSEPIFLSSFAECIVFTTIYGRSMAHKHQTITEALYDNTFHDFWVRHQWLHTILQQHMKNLSLYNTSAFGHIDPVLLFANMVAQITVLYLRKVLKSTGVGTSQNSLTIQEYDRRCVASADEFVKLTRAINEVGYFKAHLFTPMVLFCCAEFFVTMQDIDHGYGEELQEVLGALRGLSEVNNLAVSCLQSFQIYEQKDIQQ